MTVEDKKKVEVKVSGMTCAMCAQTIEKSLGNIDGVLDANVNLGAEKSYVTYNPRVITVSQMKSSIEKSGYQYLGVEGEDIEDLEKEVIENDLKKKLYRVIFGFIVGSFLMALMYIPMDFPKSYIMLVMSTPAFLYISHPIFKAAYRALKNRNLSRDVMLIKDDLIDAVSALQLSKKVMSRIKQNIGWAFFYNKALIPVAAGVLHPLRISFRPEFAGFAMAMSSVTVVSLSLMLRGYVPM